MMSDALLAQSAIDRLTSRAHTLIIEGPSYRQRDRLNQHTPALTPKARPCDAHRHLQVVPCSWKQGGPIPLASDTAGARKASPKDVPSAVLAPTVLTGG